MHGCGKKRPNQSKQLCYGEASAVCKGVQVNAETPIEKKPKHFPSWNYSYMGLIKALIIVICAFSFMERHKNSAILYSFYNVLLPFYHKNVTAVYAI